LAIFRLLRRLGAIVFVAAAALAVALIVRTSPDPIPRSDIRVMASGLNEAAAIGVPHHFLMSDATRAAHAALLSRVEGGAVLDVQDSAAYRRVFQSVLHDNQRFLGRFDAELTVLQDPAPAAPNNVAGHGIAGHHDHHDVSARKNFAAMLGNLRRLDAAGSSFERIRFANVVQKDLVDLISHLGVAPHTVSIGYAAPAEPWPDRQLGDLFEAMTMAFKTAQFEPVHSLPYWQAIDLALDRYADLIFETQSRIHSATASWERRIAGHFLSAQTLAPPVDFNRPLRPR